MASKIKGLQQWCRKMSDGYRDVDVKDFTVSWRDGLAFCAIIHRFRPDLIDFDSLSKDNVFDNNHLAFTVAEQELDIPAFLEASDMVALRTPDKLSVITYVSQYYNKLHSLPQLGGPGVKAKTVPAASMGVKRHQKSEPLSEPEAKKVPPVNTAKGDGGKGKTTTVGDKCKICGNKVYLLERHIEGGQLYHRSCYRHSDLSPTNKVYTRSPFLSPSLHGKDETKTSTPKSTGIASPQATDLSKTFDFEDKCGSKKQETAHSDDKKTSAQKFLFSDREKDSGKSVEHGKGEVQNSSHKNDNKSAATPKFDAHTFEKHGMDFLSSEKDAKDIKTPKRPLPLIFQAADSDSASDSSSKPASITAGEKDSEVKTGHVTKPAAAAEKSATPVAKPRHLVNKVDEEKMDTTETVQLRDHKSHGMPRPAPRTGIKSADLTQNKKSPPPSHKHAAARPESADKDLSRDSSCPPPLPSSAPPPLPLTAPPSDLPLPSPRRLPSSHPPSHEPASHQTTKDLHLSEKSTHAVASAKTTAASSVPTTTSLSSARVPPHSRPLSGLTTTSHTTSSSHTGAVSTGSVSVTSTTSQTKPAYSVLSIATGARKEEPMDIDTAFSRAHGQYAVMVVPVDKGQQEKATLTGLLHSLANVRNASSSSTSSTTTSITTTMATTRTVVTNQSDQTAGKSSISAEKSGASSASQSKTAAPGFVSSKLNKFQSKDSDSKADAGSALKHKDHNEGSSAQTFASSEHASATHKPGSIDVSGSTVKVHETKFSLVSDKKSVDSSTPSRGLKQDRGMGRPLSAAPASVELKLPSSQAAHQGKYATDDKPESTSVGKRDQSKSTADVLGANEVPSKRNSAIPGAPPFLQVKLRNANAAGEKKDRPKSAGSLLEGDDSSSKPEWQMEAERRKAALRSTGFVDPEMKKVMGDGDSQAPQKEVSKPVKNGAAKEQPNVTAFQKLATDFSPREDEVPDKKSPSDSKTGVIKVSLNSEIKLTITKPATSVAEKPKASKVELKSNVLPPTITPVKPERRHTSAEKEVAEAKPKLDISKAEVKGDKALMGEKAEAQHMRKKITVGAVTDDHTAPPRPASPPKPGRKKIFVNQNFDFNRSNSFDIKEEVPAPAKTAVKLTPPARPPPPRASMSPGKLSAIELQQQLLDIDSKLTELELRGRQLEDSIRGVDTVEEEDDLMLEWLQLVTEKNDLVRKETDLVYMTRETELEDEQSQIENQLHYLLSKDESEKSFEERQEEEYLIKHKLDIVNQRNIIVDSMDEDRIRYQEEDRDIAQMLQSKGLSKDASGHFMNEKGKRVSKSTFYT